MGVDVDLKPGEPIVAPGTSRVLGVMQNWYAGQPYVALQLLDGPLKGHNYYVAEQINLAVSPGDIVHPGQPIGHFAASGTGIEMGWAGDNWQQTLAQSQGTPVMRPITMLPRGSRSSISWTRCPGGQGPGRLPAREMRALPRRRPPRRSRLLRQPRPARSIRRLRPTRRPRPPPAPASLLRPAGAVPPGTPDPNAPISGTAQFQAVGGHEAHHKLHTVKFMQAVQPSPGSPLAQAAGAGGTGAPGGVDPTAAQAGQPVAGQPVVDQVTGQPGTAAPGTTPAGLGEQALSQAPAPAGSVVSVSSSLLTSGQQTFVARLSSLTGLNTRVVAGWVLAEESGSAAQGREAASNFNWLNIGYFDSGTGAIAHATPFSNPVSAAEQTAKFLKGQWGGASTGIRDILSTVGKPPGDQIMAIANSGWASSHYNNGANLRATFDELANMKVVTAPLPGAGLAVPPPGTAIS